MPERKDEATAPAAEMLAIEAVGYLAGQPEALGRFLALAGIGPNSLRAAARDPRFLVGVLDFFADERLIVAYAGAAGIDPAAFAAARQALDDDGEA
jgi:hypothetical protein